MWMHDASLHDHTCVCAMQPEQSLPGKRSCQMIPYKLKAFILIPAHYMAQRSIESADSGMHSISLYGWCDRTASTGIIGQKNNSLRYIANQA